LMMATLTGDETVSPSITRLLLLFAIFVQTMALDHTHVNNLSSKDICATTSYFINFEGDPVPAGTSQFVQREVPAHNSGRD